ncbi:hypothetical protein D3C78_1391250 [compost metagenome]
MIILKVLFLAFVILYPVVILILTRKKALGSTIKEAAWSPMRKSLKRLIFTWTILLTFLTIMVIYLTFMQNP